MKIFRIIPFCLLFFLPQSWGFYGGNAISTVAVRYKYKDENDRSKYVLENGLKAPVPYRFVIGNSESVLANNSWGVTYKVLNYYCKNPHQSAFTLKPKSVSLESTTVMFPRIDLPLPSDKNFNSKFIERYKINCDK